ncbi:MAG: signal peptidase II [Gammaproteobacteria bacterium]|nr:MAG: signal peptidase II [Gammaproteobacteria bacterium]
MLRFLSISVIVLLLDQATKLWVDGSMKLYQTIELNSFVQLTYLRNTGAAFSFLSDAGGWQRWFFVGLALIVTVVLTVWVSRLPANSKWLAISLTLILGGALGNVIDRIAYGYVIDFIDVFYQDWHWPAFNIADSAICIGVVMMLLDSFRKEPDSSR